MNRMKMLTLIALAVISVAYVGVGEATNGDTALVSPINAEEESVVNLATTISASQVVLPFAFPFDLFPTDCTPGRSCSHQDDCGVDLATGCNQGVCSGGSCFCY